MEFDGFPNMRLNTSINEKQKHSITQFSRTDPIVRGETLKWHLGFEIVF